MTKAIVLFSGGLDSTVMLAMALAEGRECYALSFDYDQRHRQEINAAKALAVHYQVPHQIIKIDVPALTTQLLSPMLLSLKGVRQKRSAAAECPGPMFHGRNALFLSFALGQAEMIGAEEIYLGCNAHDYGPYVDCRPVFIEAFQALINVATQQAVDGHPPKLVAPLLKMDKQTVIRKGMELNVPVELTWSCYSPSSTGKPCKLCDACRLRLEGFRQASC